MRVPLFIAAAFGLSLAAAVLRPAPADAQSLTERIKKQAADKAKARRTQVDDHVLSATGKAVDSAVSKTGRGADSLISKAGAVTDTVFNKTEAGVTGLAHSLGGRSRVAEGLASGRIVLPEIAFTADSSQLALSADATLTELADALKSTAGTFLIEGHVAAAADPSLAQPLSQARAAAVKAALVARGVPDARLFAMGLGATRPPTAAGTPADRIEIARMQ